MWEVLRMEGAKETDVTKAMWLALKLEEVK
jgi:hypothetical protein